MYKLILLAGLLTLSFGASVPKPKIIGGSPTPIQNVPYQIALEKYGSLYCGGAIVSKNKIITAAHCCIMMMTNEFKIRAGTTDLQANGTLYQVTEYKMHDKYEVDAHDYDIALLTITPDIEFDEVKQPVDLADVEPKEGVNGIVTGWGMTSRFSEYSDTLLGVEIPVVDWQVCYDEYDGWITPRHICAGTGDKDTCQGDGGAPLVSDNKLIGISSFAADCADPLHPRVYNNIAVMKDWIEEHL